MSDAKVFAEIAMCTKLFSISKPNQVLFDINDNDSHLHVKQISFPEGFRGDNLKPRLNRESGLRMTSFKSAMLGVALCLGYFKGRRGMPGVLPTGIEAPIHWQHGQFSTIREMN